MVLTKKIKVTSHTMVSLDGISVQCAHHRSSYGRAMEVPVRGVDLVLLDLWFALMKSSNENHQVLCMDIGYDYEEF